MTADNANTLELRGIGQPEIVELAMRSGVEELCRDIAAPYPPLPTVRDAARAKPLPVYRFAPVWDAPREAITAYRLEVRNPSPAKRQQARWTRSEFKDALKAFLAGLAHAARMLDGRIAGRGRYLMIVPISYDVISVPSGRMEVAAACRNLASEQRPFLVFEMIDLRPAFRKAG
ncbi:MAG: hypothetical protein WDM81_08110 [Rhizomicrobium sp.]